MLDSLRSELDRRDLLWVFAGALVAAAFSLVAYDQLFNLHFSAWRLYENHESTTPLAKALRGPVTGWYRPVTVALSLVGGLVAVIAALRGKWKPLVALVALTVVLIVAVEVTQSAGQLTTPTSEVDEVAIVSVVWTVLLGVVPLTVLLVAAAGLARHRS
jgi:hypothetical protein